MLDRWRTRLLELPGEFVFNQEPEPPFADWSSTSVGRYWLHAHRRTRVHRFPEHSEEVFVIGTIVATRDERLTPDFCPPGQYVVFTPTRIFSDAGSLKQVFFDRSAKSAASSLRLLAKRGDRAVFPEILHGSRPDWYWGPRTSFPNFDFLLPSQQLDLDRFEPVYRKLPEPIEDLRDDPAWMLERELCETFARLQSAGEHICLAMTGGLDSRTLFAAAIRAGVDFETYTMSSRHVHPLDVETARLISRRFGIRHTVLPVRKVDTDELNWYIWYSAGQCVTLDSDFHAAGLWNYFGQDAIHIRGLGFELGRHKYRDFLTADDERLIHTKPIEIWKRFTRPWVRPMHRYNLEAFNSYSRWVQETSGLSSIDFRDRFYLEQGIGAWCASAEYGLAATGARRISIANSSLLYRLFVAEAPDKKAGSLQKKLMRAVDPALLDYPFAKPSRTERLRFRAIDTLRALRINRRLQRFR